MYRRQLIAASGGALSASSAGCLGRVLGGGEGRRVSLADIGSVGADHPLELSVSLDSPTMGSEASPRLEIGLHSTADHLLYIGNADTWPADGLLPERNSNPEGLRLLAESEVSDLTVEHRDCPMTAFRPITEETIGGHRITPGATYRARYQLLGSAETLDGACPPGGRYSFNATYVYATAKAVETHGFETAPKSAFDWRFAVHVPLYAEQVK